MSRLKKISIYTKSGERAATTYYRVYQYIRQIDGEYRYRKMLPDGMYKKVMPISGKSFLIKITIFLYILSRVFIQILKDSIDRPDIIIISRRFVNRIFPYPYKFMLNYMKKKGTNVIWDFDDEIIVAKELSRKGFEYMSQLADHIIVASPINKKMVNPSYHDKVNILPTTDGDMIDLLTPEIETRRIELLKKEIRLIWVGTSVSLKFVKKICPYLDEYATTIKSNNKNLILTIVSDQALNINRLQHLIIRNIQWNREVAIKEMLNSHIGLMPLENNKFTRGKGGFKLIQYLSVGLPIIGSPIGINNSILSNDVGYKVNDLESSEWTEKIAKICSDERKWIAFSYAALKKWELNYNYNGNLKIWGNLLKMN